MPPFTLKDLREANTLTADDWAEEHSMFALASRMARLPWAWITLCQRLVWLYGESEALRRLNAKTEARAA